jgi:lipase maturation factor 1
LRIVAAALIVGLQCLIESTGNYTFFNLLTIALCLLLLDDQFMFCARKFVLAWWKPAQAEGVSPESGGAPAVAKINADENETDRDNVQETEIDAASRPRQPVRTFIRQNGFICCAAFLLVGLDLTHVTGLALPPFDYLAAVTSPFGISNGYGLFAVMTTARDEIIIEGSNDKVTWLAYELPFKPGDLRRPPPIVAPLQPRLDWQLWFASLSNYEQEPWLGHLMFKLLKGTPEVERLFRFDPFAGSAPKFIRASMYTYTFTDLQTLFQTGAWWRRTYKGPYFPVAALNGPAQ